MATKNYRFVFLTQYVPLALLVILNIFPSLGWAQTPFYQGKTITIIQGRDPGGTGDIRVKAMLSFLQKYIPGNPNILSEYMPGGGSRKAANYIFKTAHPDGLTIGNLGSGVVAVAILGEKGVMYELDKFIYLGSPFSNHQAILLPEKMPGLARSKNSEQPRGLGSGGNPSVFLLTMKDACSPICSVFKTQIS